MGGSTLLSIENEIVDHVNYIEIFSPSLISLGIECLNIIWNINNRKNSVILYSNSDDKIDQNV